MLYEVITKFSQYGLALFALLVALAGKRLFAFVLTKLVEPLTRRTANDLDDRLVQCVRKPLELLFLILGLFVAVQILKLPTEPTNVRAGAYALRITSYNVCYTKLLRPTRTTRAISAPA